MDLTFFYADLERLERDLCLPSEFLGKLVEEDDWSFVIKSHAIIEAALTHFLISSTDARLAHLFHRLPFGGGHASKLAVAHALGLLDDLSHDFARRLSELRNRLVHAVGHVSFAFGPYVAAMSPGDQRGLGNSIAKAVAASKWQDFGEFATKALATDAKVTIFVAVLGTLTRMLFKFDPDEYARAAEEAKARAPQLALFAFVLIIVAALAEKGKVDTAEH